MPTRIIIQHVSASKANQIEQFPAEGYSELTIGRDPSCNINFDAQRDEFVSRRHAAIRIQAGEQPSFKIADLGSRNGTIVNGEKIDAETELVPGDTIELGAGGPKFTFDLQPRPANLMARTRVMPKGGVGETKIVSTLDAARSAVPSQAEPAKTGIGRSTVIGMMEAQRTQTNRTWMYILAGVLLVVAVGGGGIYYQGRIKAEQAAAELAKHEAELAAQKEAAAKAAEASAAALKQSQEEAAAALKKAQEASEASLKKAVGMTPQDIVRKYGNATVLIEVQWRLYQQSTGKPIFHKMVDVPVDKQKTVRLPAYIQLANGAIIRWLTTEDEDRHNQAIGVHAYGSGFVVGTEGYLLTNKHVAAGWQVDYGESHQTGIVFDITEQQKPRAFNPSSVVSLIRWIPGQDPGVIFSAKGLKPIDAGKTGFEGRNDLLAVRFPGATLSLSARLLRANPKADVAEIKVDADQKLTTVDLSNGATATVGEQVTVLGYPSFSTQTVAVISSIENGKLREHDEIVPEPTVTAGNISRISEAVQTTGETVTGGVMGEAYQLTVPTSHGNSGGPVFDHDGKVIGIFTYGDPTRETTTFAVPIKYGLELFNVQRSQQ